MRALVRSSASTTIAIAAASVIAFTPAQLPPEHPALPRLSADVSLSAATTATPVTPSLGAIVDQILLNQVQNCSAICPFILQLVTQPIINFAAIPFTFAGELQAGVPLLQAIALTDATVSGPANDALTGIINNDLGIGGGAGVLPRAQHALETALVGLIEVGTTAFTQPADVLQAIDTARTNVFAALTAPLVGMVAPPPVNNALEAAAVRFIEVASALIFQAPERLLLGVTQAADALFTTLGNTGNIGTALAAVGASISTTLSDSVAFINHAITEPIPVTTAAATTGAATVKTGTAATTTASANVKTNIKTTAGTHTTNTPAVTNAVTQSPTTQSFVAVPRQVVRPSVKAGVDAVSAQSPSASGGTKPSDSVRKVDQTSNRAVSAVGNNTHHAEKNRVPGHTRH